MILVGQELVVRVSDAHPGLVVVDTLGQTLTLSPELARQLAAALLLSANHVSRA